MIFQAQEMLKKTKVYDYAEKMGVKLPGINHQMPDGQTMPGPSHQMMGPESGQQGMEYRMGGMHKLTRFDGGGYSDRNGSYDENGNQIAGPDGEILNENQLKNARIFGDGFNSDKSWGTHTSNQEDYLNNVEKSAYRNNSISKNQINMKRVNQNSGRYVNGMLVEDDNEDTELRPYQNQGPIVSDEEVDMINQRAEYKNPRYIPNPNDPYEQAMAAGKEFNKPAKQPYLSNYQKARMMGAGAGAAQMAGSIYGLATNKKERPVVYKNGEVRYLDPTQALTDADIQNKITRGALSGAANGNSGNFINNAIQAGAQNSLAKARIRMGYDAANTGTYNAAQAGIAANANKSMDATAMNDANYRNLNTKYVGDIGTSLSNIYRDDKSTKQEYDYLEFLKKEYPQAYVKYMNEKKSNKNTTG